MEILDVRNAEKWQTWQIPNFGDGLQSPEPPKVVRWWRRWVGSTAPIFIYVHTCNSIQFLWGVVHKQIQLGGSHCSIWDEGVRTHNMWVIETARLPNSTRCFTKPSNQILYISLLYDFIVVYVFFCCLKLLLLLFYYMIILFTVIIYIYIHIYIYICVCPQ